MDKGIESGHFFEIGDSGYDGQVAETQDRILIKVLDEVEKCINNDQSTVTLFEMVETQNIDVVRGALMKVKATYDHFGFTTTVDFIQKTLDDGKSEQGFCIEIDLQLDSTEISD